MVSIVHRNTWWLYAIQVMEAQLLKHWSNGDPLLHTKRKEKEQQAIVDVSSICSLLICLLWQLLWTVLRALHCGPIRWDNYYYNTYRPVARDLWQHNLLLSSGCALRLGRFITINSRQLGCNYLQIHKCMVSILASSLFHIVTPINHIYWCHACAACVWSTSL